MDKAKIIEVLQTVATALAQAADGHVIQSRVFASQGLAKLEARYAEHAEEERSYVIKCIDRILNLGGEVRNGDKKEAPVVSDALEYIRFDVGVSHEGLKQLAAIIDGVKDDMTSYDILKAHYQDEEEDMYWGERQLALAEIIGRENWYASMM